MNSHSTTCRGRTSAPPFQLIAGDKFNLALGVLAAYVLAALKDLPHLSPLARFNAGAYTNWNLTFIVLRALLRQSQWDEFLCVNSVGIWLGFRTAFAQGLDENMRSKVASMGVRLPRPLFILADHTMHTLPPAILVSSLVRARRRVPCVNVVYALTLATWAAFRQHAQLDASDVYVPHPWRRAWLGILVGMVATPPMVDACIRRDARRATLIALVMSLPWLSTQLDPRLKQKYMFEFALAATKQLRSCRRPPPRCSSTLPRAHSQPALRMGGGETSPARA